MRFKCEVPGVEEADNCSRNVALECLRAGRQEERIILAPHGEERRLVGSEVGLESRVEREVAFVVAEQIQLQLVRTRPGKVEVVKRIAVWEDCDRIRDAVRVLPDRRLGREEGAESFS